MPKVLVVYGTRPEAIKLAPVIAGLRDSDRYDVRVAVTAQHREMLDQVNLLFDIAPDHDLDILAQGQTLTDVTVRALAGLTPVIEAERPDAVVVQGDTTTTLAGALAAFYARVPVVHVEAGLRTRDPYSPFPEEINRRLVSQIAALHLAPTEESRRNLIVDGVTPSSVIVTGNTVIDALQLVLDRHGTDLADEPELAEFRLDGRPMLLVTTHRRESWGAAMEGIGRALRDFAVAHPAVQVVIPIHRNPVVREAVIPPLVGLDNVTVLEPVSYRAFARLMANAHVALTDSGGVQEEAPSLGVPVLVMRDTTERPEAVSFGTARLVGTEERNVLDAVTTLFDNTRAWEEMANAVNPYGDGAAVHRTILALDHLLLGADRPEEFVPTGVPVGADAH